MGEDLGEGSARRVKINESTTLSPSPSPSERVANAFTLAEVLITLVIIGVIAAITVPTLITKYQKEQTVTRLKKAYSALAQTTARAIADYGPVKTWEIGTSQSGEDAKMFFNKYLAPYLNLSIPAKTKAEGNWNSKYYFLNNNEHFYGDNYVRAYLSDGTSLTSYIYSNTNIIFLVDINGDKKPNKWGRDIFAFNYYLSSTDSRYNGKFLPNVAFASRETLLSDNNIDRCNKSQSGGECATLIMKDGWQIKDDYPW